MAERPVFRAGGASRNSDTTRRTTGGGTKSFIELKGAMDGVLEEQQDALQKAGKLIAKNLASGDRDAISNTIDKLLVDFSDADKYVIMKYAFMMMC